MSEASTTPLYAPEQCSALILAGGLGKRLQPLVSDRPKPLAPILGRPFLFWLIKYLRHVGLRQIVVAAGHKGDQVKSFLDSHHWNGVDIKCVIEKEPLGTGGAIRFGIHSSRFESPCWLISNGDSIGPIDLANLLRLLVPDHQGVITGIYRQDASDFGTLSVDENDTIHGFHEKKAGSGWVNAGIYLLKKTIVDQFSDRPSSLEKEIFPRLIENGAKFKLYRCEHPFLDIGTPSSFAIADTFIERYFKEIVYDDHQ